MLKTGKSDLEYMMEAIDLARSAGKEVGKNPKVGCLIVHDGRVIGKACHEKYGGPHAEVNAIANVARDDRHLLPEASYYVTLEPCSHYGKTPPCAKRIAELGAKEVVIAGLDPNPKVAGRGVEILLKAGIDVRLGIAEEEARKINKEFFARMEAENPPPRVFIKMGMTLDGKIATRSGDSKWITGQESRRQVQKLRAMSDAIVTGLGTVLADNPRMTYRGYEDQETDVLDKSPVRVILDSHLKTPPEAEIVKTPPRTLIYTLSHDTGDFRDGVEIIRAPNRNGHVDPAFVVSHLAGQGMKTIMIESGPSLATAFLNRGLVSEFHLFIAPKIIGGDGIPVFGLLGVKTMKDILKIESSQIERIEEDIYVHGHCRRSRDD